MRKLKLSVLLSGALMLSAGSVLLSGCAKDGVDGKDGTNGADAIATCKECHNPNVVDRVATEFVMSKHSYGEASTSEAGNTSCGPCHEQQGFKYVCQNNISTVFTWDAINLKWINPYATVSSDAFGPLTCFTCHSSLHTTYGYSDLSALTTVAPVPMTMWGGAKTINLTQDGGKSHLCIKCHQPRPMTCSAQSDSRLLNYDSIKTNPNLVFWDSLTGFVSKYIKPSYRMHVHYGAVGAVFAGMGGIEFPGSEPYESSAHTTLASCQNCHMAPITGSAGGHSFKAKGNFNGCNVSGCHTNMSATASLFTDTRTEIKGLLDTLAKHINLVGAGHDILHKDVSVATDGSYNNLWYGLTTNNYDGYLDILDASSNPLGYWSLTSTTPAKRFPVLKFVHVGAIINFQFCLREYSLGVHNTQYSRALLTNSIAALVAAGY